MWSGLAVGPAALSSKEDPMPFEDKTITCVECGAEFLHTAEDQARYAERGFTNDPKRCRECREKRKVEAEQQAEEGDKTLTCIDCGTPFIHSAKDQAYYAERGFTNEPKRCRECREKRKAQAARNRRRSGPGRGGHGGGRGRGGPRESRGQRESYEAICAECGARTTVPFKPVQGRPVYCRDCYRSRR
jgi:CxxC-x17-CxxC domain-containing protein